MAEHVLIAKARDLPGRRPLTAAVATAWDLSLLAADYRRFLQRFGAVIERFRATRDGAHDPQQCFVVRTLLIHAYRRVLLRDPLLPAALLPLDWPGAAAYALCRDFYRLPTVAPNVTWRQRWRIRTRTFPRRMPRSTSASAGWMTAERKLTASGCGRSCG